MPLALVARMQQKRAFCPHLRLLLLVLVLAVAIIAVVVVVVLLTAAIRPCYTTLPQAAAATAVEEGCNRHLQLSSGTVQRMLPAMRMMAMVMVCKL